MKFLALATLSLLLSDWPASAAVLDQSNSVPANAGGYFVYNQVAPAQVVTAGISGELVGVEIEIELLLAGGTSPLNLEIWSLATGPTLDSLLATAFLPSTEFTQQPAYEYFDLSDAPPIITAGQTFAIVLRSNAIFEEQLYGWRVGPGSGYPAGAAYGVLRGTAILSPKEMSSGGADFAFRTFVNVPEPSTYVMAAMGIVALLSARRRKRCSAQP